MIESQKRVEVLSDALVLAVIAPTKEKSQDTLRLAEVYARAMQLTPLEVKQAQRKAERLLEKLDKATGEEICEVLEAQSAKYDES